MKKLLLVHITLPLFLMIGCGKGDSGTATTQSVSAAPQFAAQSATCPSCTTTPNIPITGSYGYYFASYQFQEAGSCNTGYRQFSGTFQEQVRQQMCQVLRSPFYNGGNYFPGGCSPNLRAQAIAATCTPYNM